MATRDMQNVVYTDDQGNEYKTKVAADVFSQVGASTEPKIGGRDLTGADGNLPVLPRQLKPRTVTVSAAGQAPRRVVCLSADADLFTGVETTITLPVFNDADGAAFTRYAASGERKRSYDPNH